MSRVLPSPVRSAWTAVLLFGLAAPLAAQHPTPEGTERTQPRIVDGVDYRVYARDGSPASLQELVEASLGEDVLLVGEEHGDMVGHAFETELFALVLDRIADPYGAGRAVVLSLEMFERDVQYVLDEYLAGLVTEEHFLRSSRPWDDYDVRYRPLVEAAKAGGVPVVAANAPRRYVNRVSREGPFALEALSERARSYLPPLPYPGPSRVYRAQWDSLMASMLESDSTAASDTTNAAPQRPYITNPNVIQAQALWDAAMGHAIAEALVRRVGAFVVHFAGSFHVERGTGIPERIADYRPGSRVVTVVMTKVEDIDAWSVEEHGPLADWVVLTRKPAEPVPEG